MTGDPKQHLRSVIDRLLREGTAVAADGSLHTLFPVAIPATEGEALRDWVIRERAVRTIEIGLGYGISTLHILEGLLASGDPDARHVAIDPHQATRFANCGLQFIEEAGARHLLEFHAQESMLALPRLLADGRTFDFAFVDGNHRFDGVFVDLAYLGRMVKRGGVIFLDDYQLPGIARAASFFVANLGWTIEEISATDDLHQWAVLRTSPLADSRPFDFFADF